MSEQNLKEWKRKLSEIWNCVLKENFVFSYRNILEVNARVELDCAMCCWHSNLIQDMTSVKSELINRLYNVEYDSLESTFREMIQELNTMVYSTTHNDKIMDFFFIQHEKKAIFEQWKYQTEQFFNICKEKVVQKIRDNLDTIFKIEKQKQEIHAKSIDCRREIVSEVRMLFAEFNERDSFDVPETVGDLFHNFWKRWKSSFQNTNFFDNPDISNDMQQVFLESSHLKQLDVYSSRREYILDKTNFKEIGRGEFDEISNINSVVQDDFCYYSVSDYQHGIKIWGKLKNFLKFSKDNEADSKDIQAKLQSIFSDHNRFVDELIGNIPQNSNYDINYFYCADYL